MKLDVYVCYFKNGDVCASRDCRACGVTVEREKTKGVLSFDLGGEPSKSASENNKQGLIQISIKEKRSK